MVRVDALSAMPRARRLTTVNVNGVSGQVNVLSVKELERSKMTDSLKKLLRAGYEILFMPSVAIANRVSVIVYTADKRENSGNIFGHVDDIDDLVDDIYMMVPEGKNVKS